MSAPRASKVSLCMIVRNEENNLVDCLDAVAPLMDEIIIVDTGSTDRTKEIAGRYTAHVYDFPWCDDFAAARNESLRHATGDWIFWLDADDRVSPENLGKLQTLLQQLDERPRAYFMDTVLHYPYECEGARLVSHQRLFRRHPDLLWRGRVHEQIVPDPAALNYETVWINIRIDHLGYQNAVVKQRKRQRNVRLLQMDYAVDPDDPNTLLHLALADAELGKNAEARGYLQRIVANGDRRQVNLQCTYQLLAELSLRDGKAEESLSILTHALKEFPRDGAILFKQADIYFDLGRYDLAAALERIQHSQESHQHYGGPADIKEKLAPRKLAEVVLAQGQLDQAVALLQSVLSKFPDDTRSWYLLGGIYSSQGRADELEAACQRLHACPQGSYFAAVLLTIWYFERLMLAPAAQLIEWLITELPEAPLPRVLRCQLLALEGASLDARLSACRDVLRLDPGNISAKSLQTVLENTRPVVAASAVGQWATSVTCASSFPVAVSAP